jgi:uncharacterized membrane protein YidH (DUF202 family)
MGQIKQLAQYVSYVIFTVIVIGLGLAIYGGYTYFDATQRIKDLEETQKRTEEYVQSIVSQAADPSTIDATGLAFSGIQLRKDRNEQVDRQHNGRWMFAAGLIVTALGWLSWDLMKSRQRRKIGEPIPAEDTPPPST